MAVLVPLLGIRSSDLLLSRGELLGRIWDRAARQQDVTGVKAAQGLAMQADGTFLVVDEKSGDIRVAMGCRQLLASPFGGQGAGVRGHDGGRALSSR